MQNFKMLPAIVIPGLMFLSSVAFIIFAVQQICLYDVIEYLQKNSTLLPYLSLISVAGAFVVGAVIVRLVSTFFKKIDQPDGFAIVLQHGSVELNRSLDDTYKVVIMLRLLYGAIPLFCISLLAWLNFWPAFWSISYYILTTMLLVLLASLFHSKDNFNKNIRLKHSLCAWGCIDIFMLFCFLFFVNASYEYGKENIVSIILMLMHLISAPLIFWVHKATIRDHDRRRGAFNETIQKDLYLKYIDQYRKQ